MTQNALKQIERFHGHIGPYVVIGYKMGEHAKHLLGPDPFTKRAIVYTGTKPPLSCIIDGIQLSSGCTFGKGNISVTADNLPKAQFIDNNGHRVVILLKPSIQHDIDTTVTEENCRDHAEQLYQKKPHELFDIALGNL